MSKSVAVVGASPKSDRYSYRAMLMLEDNGFKPLPVNPAYSEILGHACVPSLKDVDEEVDTVTIYLGSQRNSYLKDEVISLNPSRVIFNPGTENSELQSAFEFKGIECLNACTLVMLTTGQF